MIKIIDVDQLFDKYISDYVYGNIGKVKPEEIENNIPKLYLEFGDVKLKELDGKSPNEYYKSFTCEELLDCLKAHLEKDVPVSDFLCEALTDEQNEKDLVKALDGENDEEYILYLMNILGELSSKLVKKRYLEFILWDYLEPIKELATEQLKVMAEDVKEDVLGAFTEADEIVKGYFTEILAECKGDERVFDILVAEFAKHQDNVPLYAGYLAKYGDERALPFLLASIEREKISYADFEELRFAIEALGGKYDKERDFSADKTYRRIKNAGK